MTPEQLAFQKEYNLVGVRTTTDVPFTITSQGNSVGIPNYVGSSTPISVPSPITPTGDIQSSSSVGYKIGTGWWMGYDIDGTPKFSIGDSTTNYLTWTGTAVQASNLQLLQSFTASESISAYNAVSATLYSSLTPALDTKGLSRGLQDNNTTNVTVTVGNNSNRAFVLILISTAGASSGLPSAFSATYAGVTIPLTQVQTDIGGNGYRVAYGVLAAPATGANTLSMVTTAGGGGVYSYYSVYNVAQNSSADAGQTGFTTGTDLSISDTTVTDGAFTIGAIATTGGGTIGTPAGNVYTSDTQTITGGNPNAFAGDSNLATVFSASSSMTLSTTGGNAGKLGAVVSVKPITTPVVAVQKSSSSAAGARANGFIGFAQAAATTGNTVNVILSGITSGLTGIQAGGLYYLNDVNGTIGNAAGTVTRKVGIGINSTQLFITNIW